LPGTRLFGYASPSYLAPRSKGPRGTQALLPQTGRRPLAMPVASARRARMRLPLVLVTALSKEEERLKGLRAGADAYITKGAFDQNGLLGRIRELVK